MGEVTGIKERPILFSGPMVKAILEGRKTQTRRVMKPQPFLNDSEGEKWWFLDRSEDGYGKTNAAWKDGNNPFWTYCPYGQPGDRLWVRETLRRDLAANVWYYAAGKPEDWVVVAPEHYSDSLVWAHHKEGDVCVSIHMPRWASRITLEITKIRVERVQDISEADCAMEGIDDAWLVKNHVSPPRNLSFKYLWDSINEDRGFGWDANPWTWVIEFKRVFLAD